MVTKAKVTKAKKRTNDPQSLRRAVAWYRAGKGERSLRDACKRYRSVSFERLRKAAKAGSRRRT